MLPDDAVEVAVPDRYDLRRTITGLRHGAYDPCVRYLGTTGGDVWRTTRTPAGPATQRLCHRPGAGSATLEAWGPGAGWSTAHAADLLGLGDDPSAFDAQARSHRLVHDLHRRFAGLRIPRSRAVAEAAMPLVLEQKVTGLEAKRSWRALVRLGGETPPGPVAIVGELGLLLPPAPALIADLPYHALHPLGIERARADRLRSVARHAARLDDAARAPTPAEGHAALRAVPGVGVWTAAEVAVVALGDADAVSVGDYHLKHQVAWALAREPRATDERMLELLAPFAGHRGRVCRLVVLAGLRAPRYGPRLAPRDIRRH